ncbi:MAG: hypothetical protein GC190_03255 [Alphaproteobacteria bacterium]|nr:hypothetical protein [Alphaproteobacteria bacterium]
MLKAAQTAQRSAELKAAAATLRQNEITRLSSIFVPSLRELRSLTSQRFEDEVAALFKQLGYEVEQTPYSNDAGRDAVMHKGGHVFLLECKKYDENSQSGRPDLQKFHSAIVTDKAIKGFFVTTGTVTREATEFAQKVPIEVVDGPALLRLMTDARGAGVNDDRYHSACVECGRVVSHRLREPVTVFCANGHIVRPTISVNDLLNASGAGVLVCRRCGGQMRRVNGRNGPFWGCSNYPNCRYTRSIGRQRRRRGA